MIVTQSVMMSAPRTPKILKSVMCVTKDVMVKQELEPALVPELALEPALVLERERELVPALVLVLERALVLELELTTVLIALKCVKKIVQPVIPIAT